MGIQYTKELRFCVSYRRSLKSFKFMSFHILHLLIFFFDGYITNSQIAHLPLEMIVQLVKYCNSFTKDAGRSLCFLKLSVFLKFRSFLISWIVQQEHLIEKIIKAFVLLILYGFSLIRLLLIWAYRNHSHEETNLKTTLNGCKRNSILPQIGSLKFPKHMLYFLP